MIATSLTEWAFRSAVLITLGAVLLKAFRVKDPAVRLVVWTVVLAGSLAVPVLKDVLPPLTTTVTRLAELNSEPLPSSGFIIGRTAKQGAPAVASPVSWARVAIALYAAVALALLLRTAVGQALSYRMLHASRATGRATEGIEIRQFGGIAAPVTLGVLYPAIVLPADFHEWPDAKLEAVLAHERSHVQRFDAPVQLLSAVHRALLWHSPLSWFLHRRIVRLAEEVSDDAAVAVVEDRALYAEVLLGFMQGGLRGANWFGVPMARYGRPDERIHRILDGAMDGAVAWTRMSRRRVAAMVTIALPFAYLAASPLPRVEEVVQKETAVPVAQSRSADLQGLGNVTPLNTVDVKSRVDGHSGKATRS